MATLTLAVVIAIARPSPTPPAPYAGWWIAGFYVFFVVFTGLLFTRASWGTVEVHDDGLHVHGRLVVPADQLGTVRLLSRSSAGDLAWFGRWQGRRVKSSQNLYGGGMGWGRGMLVEHLPPGGEASLWLLPGPRAEELVEALASVRAAAERGRSAGR